MRYIYLLSTLCLLALSTALPIHAQSGAIDAGQVEGTFSSAVRRIEVTSPDRDIALLARRAFSIHGGFELAESGRAMFVIQLDKLSPTRVQLTVRGSQTVTREINGEDWRDATLKACDEAVRLTLGIPGFFAGRLAFSSNRSSHREIYMSDLFFQRVRQLTHNRNNSIFPHWSPDGRRILYTGYFLTGFPDVLEIDLDTFQIRPFASFRNTNTGGVFSPDGRSVALILSSSGNPELYISDARGKNLRRLTNNNSLEATPTWSPDGKRLIVTSDGTSRPLLYEISASGGPLRPLPTNISRYCAEPSWNPVNADLVAFTAATGGGFQLALFNMRTREAAKFITGGPGDNKEPTWTNDGRHLIYTKSNASGEQLWILDVESFDSRTGMPKTYPINPRDFGNASQASFVYPSR